MSGPRAIGTGAAYGLAALALVIGAAIGIRGGPPATSPPSTAATFALPRLADPRTTFDSASLLGEVAVLNVWASWCVACREEHALLMALAAGKEDVSLYGLNYRDERADALRWLEFYGDPYRITGSDASGEVGESLGVRGIPATIVIDGDGVVRYRHSGPLDALDWQRHIAPLLGGAASGQASRGAS